MPTAPTTMDELHLPRGSTLKSRESADGQSKCECPTADHCGRALVRRSQPSVEKGLITRTRRYNPDRSPLPSEYTVLLPTAQLNRIVTNDKAYGDRPLDLVAACQACNNHVGNPARISPDPTPRSNW